jgi:thiol:disulfide interchange protein
VSPTSSGKPKIYDVSADPKADIQAALAASKSDGRNVLLDFGADWCPDCVVLDRLYAAAEVKPLLDAKYRIVRVEVGRFDHNVDVSDRYGGVIAYGIPALVVLDSTGAIKVTTRAGEFANARTMKAPDVRAFLDQWAPAS